jgi:hypothetical protein
MDHYRLSLAHLPPGPCGNSPLPMRMTLGGTFGDTFAIGGGGEEEAEVGGTAGAADYARIVRDRRARA